MGRPTTTESETHVVLFMADFLGRGFNSRRLHQLFFSNLPTTGRFGCNLGVIVIQSHPRWPSSCIVAIPPSALRNAPRWDRSYRRCKCPIHAEGTLRLDGFIRRGTSETDWDRAEQVKRKWEAAGTVDDDATSFQEPPSLAEQQTDSRISIVAAVTAYLSDAKARNLSEATLYKLKIIFEKQFVPWCAHKGYRFLIQVDLDALREFRDTWKDAPLARSKKQARLIGFFYFCVRSAWLIQNPALRLGRIKVVQKPTGYFDPDQYSAVIDATYCYRDTRFEQGDGIQAGGARIRTLT